MHSLAWLAAALTGLGVAQGVLGLLALWRFLSGAEFRAGAPGPADLPGVTVLRPLYGDEPLLEEALASACAQDYPQFQVVFGVQNPADPARAVAERVRRRFPQADVTVHVDDTADGPNRKVANLVNMLQVARHAVVVIADSDVHAAPDYLRRIAAALATPGVGLVTTLYAGRPANRSAVALLGAGGISHGFLPSALLGRALGRQDSLGATMALRRATLAAIGGFEALLPHLADDHVLGHKVRALGLSVRLAATIPATTVAEHRLADLWRHELRWGRTIRALAPVSFAASAVQYPLAWAALALALSGFAAWAAGMALTAWAARALVVRGIDRLLAPTQTAPLPRVPLWLLPLRDLISISVLLASHAGDQVVWRGRPMRADGLGGAAAARA